MISSAAGHQRRGMHEQHVTSLTDSSIADTSVACFPSGNQCCLPALGTAVLPACLADTSVACLPSGHQCCLLA